MRRFILLLILLSLVHYNLLSNENNYTFQTTVPAELDLKTGYINSSFWKSGVPFGGIGCGSIELTTDGGFQDANFLNNFDYPTPYLQGAFFALAIRDSSQTSTKAYMLRLKRDDEFKNVVNISNLKYLGLFPRAEIKYIERYLPVEISLNAYSSLIPNNIKDSSLPVVFFDFSLKNISDNPVELKLLFSFPNILGYGGTTLKIPYVQAEWDEFDANFQIITSLKRHNGILFEHNRTYDDRRSNSTGKYFIGINNTGKSFSNIEYIKNYGTKTDNLSFWDDFKNWLPLKQEYQYEFGRRPTGAVAVTLKIKPKEKIKVPFVLGWWIPTMQLYHEWPKVNSPLKLTKMPTTLTYIADNDLETFWKSKEPLKYGDRITLSMKTSSSESIDKIILKKTAIDDFSPKTLAMLVSQDGDSFTSCTILKNSDLKNSINCDDYIISLPKPALAKFIRLVNLEDKEKGKFCIAEIEILNSKGKKVEIDFSKSYSEFNIMDKTLLSMQEYHPAYTSYFLKDKNSAGKIFNLDEILFYALNNKDRFFKELLSHQNLILNSNLPYPLKLMIINDAFPIYTNTILSTNDEFSVLESLIDMWGSLGTMDQRLASHAYILQMFPDLDKMEMMLFAKCQQGDGRITHFCGNIYQAIGKPEIPYGITDWPDLSASFILQALKYYKWTNDKEFFYGVNKNVMDALNWLISADKDGDKIAEGGSSFDYESMPKGAFSYTALLQAAAFQAGREWGIYSKNSQLTSRMVNAHAETVKSSIKLLWNGKYFIKWSSSDGKEKKTTSFVSTLAGDWAEKITGLKSSFPNEIINKELNSLVELHFKKFYPVPPMEVTDEPKPVVTNDCFILQHIPYFGCEAISRGMINEGLGMFYRLFEITYLINKDPWHKYLNVKLDGRNFWGRSYMTAHASWHLFNALSGISLDLPNNMIFVSPKVDKLLNNELHIPVFLGKVHLWLDYIPKKKFTIKVLNNYFKNENVPLIKYVAKNGDDKNIIELKKTMLLKSGEELDLLQYESNLSF